MSQSFSNVYDVALLGKLGVRSIPVAFPDMRESLRLVSSMLVSELDAAIYMCRQRPLNDAENAMVGRTYAAGFEQIFHLHRELLLTAIAQEQADAGIEVR